MRLEIDFTKSLHENASAYYAAAKKAKRKLEGLARGISAVELKIVAQHVAPKKKAVKKRERKWFEKFHWFFTSEGFLVIGGRDAKSNETIVTKFMQQDDVYFHADIHGAPHVILKTEGKTPLQVSLSEAAVFAAAFSRAWQEQLPAIDVYSARPEQVTKKAQSGESLGMGAFMVYGERTWYKKTRLECAVGMKKTAGEVEFFSGPPSSVGGRSDYSVELKFGGISKGDAAKKVLGFFANKSGLDLRQYLDDIVALLPGGGFSLGFED